MYGLQTKDCGWIPSQCVARMLTDYDTTGENPEVFRHLCAIENLEARGAQYANHDFDVLSAAHAYACKLSADAIQAERFARLRKSWRKFTEFDEPATTPAGA